MQLLCLGAESVRRHLKDTSRHRRWGWATLLLISMRTQSYTYELGESDFKTLSTFAILSYGARMSCTLENQASSFLQTTHLYSVYCTCNINQTALRSNWRHFFIMRLLSPLVINLNSITFSTKRLAVNKPLFVPSSDPAWPLNMV